MIFVAYIHIVNQPLIIIILHFLIDVILLTHAGKLILPSVNYYEEDLLELMNNRFI